MLNQVFDIIGQLGYWAYLIGISCRLPGMCGPDWFSRAGRNHWPSSAGSWPPRACCNSASCWRWLQRRRSWAIWRAMNSAAACTALGCCTTAAASVAGRALEAGRSVLHSPRRQSSAVGQNDGFPPGDDPVRGRRIAPPLSDVLLLYRGGRHHSVAGLRYGRLLGRLQLADCRALDWPHRGNNGPGDCHYLHPARPLASPAGR